MSRGFRPSNCGVITVVSAEGAVRQQVYTGLQLQLPAAKTE